MTSRVLLIDNYDSFTWNLAQAFMSLGAEVAVHRNDEITVAEATALKPTHVVISPGPGKPQDARVSLDMLQHFMGQLPVLGVCLGHQSLGHVSGAVVSHAPRLMHGKMSLVHHDGRGLFQGLDNPMECARYHSLIVERGGLPDSLTVTATTQDDEVMALRHRTLPVAGVQFHPESVLTPQGQLLLANFLTWTPSTRPADPQ